MRLENLILHKHLYRSENAPPGLGGRSGRPRGPSRKERKEKEKMFVQIINIWYYYVYIHKLKLSIKYFNLNITVTSHAEKVSMFTRQISDTRLTTLIVRCTYSGYGLDVITKNTWICDQKFLGKHVHHW